jgi:hypothetical protein
MTSLPNLPLRQMIFKFMKFRPQSFSVLVQRNMKFFLLSAVFTIIEFVSCQNLETSCLMPEDIPSSRQNRLHHPCESNQNRDFAITTHDNFYCVSYSSIGIALFGAESKFEIKIEGEWSYEQSGAENFEVQNKTMRFSASMDDVRVMIRKKGGNMPRITSVIVEDGSLPEAEISKQEYCSCEGCGIQDEAVAVILGGVEARSGAWPWNAAIYYKPSITKLQFRCGATIINKRTLITTATCLFTNGIQISPEKLLIAVKETTLYGASSRKINVQQIKIHENFTQDDRSVNQLKYDFNVGILITDSAIPFSLHVNAICLPESEKFNFKDKQGVVVGWGFNKDHELSQRLQQLEGLTS